MTRERISKVCIGLSTLLLAAGLSACGGGSSGSTGGPTVVSTDPASAATGVALNSGFAATFSEAMDPATLTGATFTLTASGSPAVTGTVTSAGTTALFRPTASLTANTAYTATITTGAKSAAGKALNANYSWHVTTGSTSDSTKPTVSSTSPAKGATAAPTNSTVTATFSKSIDPSTVLATTFTLLKKGVTPVAGTVTLSGAIATFTPAAALSATTSYTATIAPVKDLAGNAMASAYLWTFTTGAVADTTPPTVGTTMPADAATAVATNTAITAIFSKPMTPTTIATSFTVTAPGAVAVAGTVTYSGVTATFQPNSALAASTAFTATITTAAKDLAGNALAANKTWSFTTGASADTTPPTVSTTSPLPAATGVLTTAAIQATFSKAMLSQTLTGTTFTVTGPGASNVPGAVSYDAVNKVANFLPTTALAANTNYTAKVKGGAGGATDLAGNALASDYSWGFLTGSHASLSPVLLGSSANYVVLAQSAVTTAPTSAITGDLGLSPAAESYYTGFSQTDNIGYATSPQVTGKIYAADQAPPTPATLTTAVSDMQTAYTDAAGRPTPDFLELSSGAIGGLTLSPGLYKWTSTVTIPSDVTFSGAANDVWILQISGDLTMSSAKNVFLAGGAKARNIFWQVSGTVDIGTTAHFEGIILSQTAITLETGASMNGRALAQTAVTLNSATLTQPAP